MSGEGKNMRGRVYLLTAIAAALVAAAPAEAKKKSPPPPPVPVAAPQVALPNSPNGSTVRYYYERRNYAPIWFRAGAGDEAIGKLLAVLRAAPVDGMANGPQVAANLEAAIAAARSGDAMKQKEAELALSAAWVDYVQTLQRPNNNVIWGDPYLTLKPGNPDRILALAGAAPSLASHLQSVSSVNPIYAKIREVAVVEAAANGGRASDKVMLNLERARILPGSGKFVLVNSAEQRLHMYENWQDVGSMKVVVGSKAKYGLPTPIVASTVHYAIANPYWHVPPHLIRKMAPNIAKGPEAYMKAHGYEVISDFSEHPTILPASSVNWKAVAAGTEKVNLRQRPNGENSMGKMKFPFPNREGIYLHDTPKRIYFDAAKTPDRAQSNGCIRVEDYRRLAYWLFGRDVAAVGSDPEQHISIPRGVPVYVTYLTMVPDASGIATFADRYDWDRPGVLAGGMDISIGGVGAASREAASVGGAGGVGGGNSPQ
jgi:murein L,D-transpeptidase YcbB/YkuD